METDQIEILRIHIQMKRQWETLTSKVLVLAILIALQGAAMVAMVNRITQLSSEVEQLKSRQTQRSTVFAPVEPKPSPASPSAGDGQNETKAAGN
jgi:hypothetical protein